MRLVAWLGSLAVLTLILTGCSRAASGGAGNAEPRTIQLSATEFAFSPTPVRLKAGETVVLELQNKGTVLHDLSVGDMPVQDPMEMSGASHDMSGMDMHAVTVHVAVGAGQSGKVKFRPTKPGTYTFDCTQPGHKDSGMTGTIVVE
ncbi:MAG: cupredoxin domain-containing protein [Bacillota bacterium]